MTKYLVQTAHHSNYPNPIHFRRGEPLRLGKRDDEYPGWVWTTTTDGNQGWAPLVLMDLVDDHSAIAQRDYNARELETEPGDRVEVIEQLNDWSWVIPQDGEPGWVPSHTLTPLKPS